jgi:hypothetical protein
MMTIASPESSPLVAPSVPPRLWEFDIVPRAGMAGHGKYAPAQGSDQRSVVVELVVL